MFYISVTQGGSMGGDFLLEARPASGEILSGTAVIPWRKGKDNDIGGPLLREVLRISEEEEATRIERGGWWHTLHVLEIDEDQFYFAEDGTLVVHYVWWGESDGLRGVVTTRNIFIMGEAGQTIARVR